MATADIGFTNVIRVGKLGIITKLEPRARPLTRGEELSLSGASFSFRQRMDIILETPFALSEGMTAERLFELHGEVITFRILKAREPFLLKPWVSPDPYTDDFLVNLRFDDLMTLFMVL